MFNPFLLIFHLGWDWVRRSKLSGESLERDTGAVIECLEVRWGKIATLILPSLVVDGASFLKTFCGMIGQSRKAHNDVNLFLSNVYYLRLSSRSMLHLLDTS